MGAQRFLHLAVTPLRRLLRSRSIAAALAVAGVASALAIPELANPTRWSADSLFYETTSREIQGQDHAAARHAVFFGHPGNEQRLEAGSTPGFARTSDPTWIEYSERFYERRLVVPAVAAAAATTGIVPHDRWSFRPLTDSWGLALTAGALLAASLVVDRGAKWLVLWGGTLFTLALTREVAAVFVFASLIYSIRMRSRIGIGLLVTAAIAVVPPFLMRGATPNELLAYGFSGNQAPETTSWSFIATRYTSELLATLRELQPFTVAIPNMLAVAAFLVVVVVMARRRHQKPMSPLARVLLLAAAGFSTAVLVAPIGGFAFANQHFPYVLAAAVGLLLLASPTSGADPSLVFARYGAVGACLLLLTFPQPRGFRAELIVLPFAAIGSCRLVELTPARRMPSNGRSPSQPLQRGPA